MYPLVICDKRAKYVGILRKRGMMLVLGFPEALEK